jgi:hypothetical protein
MLRKELESRDGPFPPEYIEILEGTQSFVLCCLIDRFGARLDSLKHSRCRYLFFSHLVRPHAALAPCRPPTLRGTGSPLTAGDRVDARGILLTFHHP